MPSKYIKYISSHPYVFKLLLFTKLYNLAIYYIKKGLIMNKTKKIAVSDKLLNDGYFESRKELESWVMLRKIFVNDELIFSCGQKVDENATVKIKDYDKKYVNKGGLKLESALQDLQVHVKKKVAIDAGASTGGFTDCLIQHGALKVYAVDVGFGQLSGKLRQDPKVINMEKVNLGDEVLLHLEDKPEIASLDLSYLSLRKAIPICSNIMNNKGLIVALVKPLFEVDSPEIKRMGQIDDENIYRDILFKLVDYIDNELNFNVFGITYSHVTGNKGTIEFFLGISLDNQRSPLSSKEIEKQISYAVENGISLEKYKK
jgi:23S rRNA (cytidine1920-2'-O)/16S rRNA (cytidine1409-2'-O)-methyltransferase